MFNKKGTLVMNGIDYSNGGGSSNGNNYSTEEQIIGTWIDGKPLYRKVLHGITGSVVNRYEIPLSNITLVHFYGIVKNVELNTYFRPDNYISSYLDSGSLFLYGTSQFNNANYDIIIEYTKTTDTATRMTDAQALVYVLGQEVLEKELSDDVATASLEDETEAVEE